MSFNNLYSIFFIFYSFIPAHKQCIYNIRYIGFELVESIVLFFSNAKVKRLQSFLVVGQKNKSNTLIFILLIISSLQKWFN